MNIDTNQPTHETAPPTQSGSRRNVLALVGALTVVVVVGAAVLLASGDGGEVSPAATSEPVSEVELGPITSFEDIAGTYEVIHEIQGLSQRVFFHFFEDGTVTRSTNQDLVEDDPSSITETRFEGTKIFLTETKGICGANPDAIYEIHLLENGNLQFVGVDEDPCTIRSTLDGSEWVPVP